VPEIKTTTKVLATVPYKAAHLDRLIALFAPASVVVTGRDDDSGIRAALETAAVAVIAGALDERFLAAPNLRWVHCDAAGIESSAKPEVFERGLMLTASAGRSSPVLAEHAFFLALSLIYDSFGLHDAQKAHRWGLPGYSDRRGLFSKTLGIVGLGGTGSAVASLGKALGMTVLAYRHRPGPVPQAVDRQFVAEAGDSIGQLLRLSDVVVLACRLTDETFHLIGAAQLEAMKPTAYLINMARGAVVDEAALLCALNAGTIGGAGFDTFETEPLPAESPLWDAPNMVITPHATPEMPDMVSRCLDIIGENVKRYRADEPLLNALTPTDVYTPGRRVVR
jgi:phosphoglycerate dehydrogenase-like enzyme